MIEEWKDVYIQESKTTYQVSNFGRVINTKEGADNKELKAKRNSLQIYRDGVGKSCNIAYLVAKMFVPNISPEEKTKVLHLDGNVLNNHVGNLEWVTKKEHALRTRIGNKKSNEIKVPKNTKILELPISYLHSIGARKKPSKVNNSGYTDKAILTILKYAGYDTINSIKKFKEITSDWVYDSGSKQLVLKITCLPSPGVLKIKPVEEHYNANTFRL